MQNCYEHLKKNKTQNSPCIYHGEIRMQDFDIKYFYEYTIHMRKFHL